MTRVMAVDPGTQHTGVAVGEMEDGELRILHFRKIQKKQTVQTYRRIAEILEELLEIIDEYGVEEIWTEMFVPYGIRRGQMYNMNLVGAILYMPVTRQKKLKSYAIQAAEWKKWLTANAAEGLTPYDKLRDVAEDRLIELDDAAHAAISDPHVGDAFGMLMFTYFGSPPREHQASYPQN